MALPLLFAGGICNCPSLFEGAKRAKLESCPCDFLTSDILGGSNTSILSVLNGVHSIGKGFLSYFTCEEANNLRLVCREMNQAVTDFNWNENNSIVIKNQDNFDSWVKCFPNALYVELDYGNLRSDDEFFDYDLSKFNIPKNMNFIIKIHIYCKEQLNYLITKYKYLIKYLYLVLHAEDSNEYEDFTDNDFRQLAGIKNLDINNFLNITNNTLKYIQGVENLDITWCYSQDTGIGITDDGFKYLRGIQKLKMGDNPQLTNNIFQYLSGIKILDMSEVENSSIDHHDDQDPGGSNITDEKFHYIESVEILNITNLNKITGEGFKYLKNLKKLIMNGCKRSAYENAKKYCPNTVIVFDEEY